ncbi:MAG: DNA-directed RNA polymerase subunit A'' [Candidatus Aenigmatarchaeota archaeon]
MSEELQKKSLDEIHLPPNLMEEIENVVKEKKLNKEQKKILEDEVKKIYLNSGFEPGEAIGIIAAQSISEPATQMSCPADEKIIIKNDGEIKIVKIGDFVDSTILEFGSKKIGDSEICDLPKNSNLLALSLDQNEKVRWKKIISCIRHRSPKKMMKIKTRSGREIIATDYHSFVVRKNNTIVPMSGKKLRIGDRIPVIKFLPENCNDYINFESERLKLDNSFGWFVGAYLSEGNINKTQINISNIDKNFLSNARNFANKLRLKYKERDFIGQFGPSHSFILNFPNLARLILDMCDTGSYKKRVPEFAYSASEEFVSSLLRGYFDGDGSISVSRKMIRIHSNSEELVDGIKLLLTRFGIFAYKSKDKKQFYLIIPYKYAPTFLEKIGSDIREKREKLKKLAKLARKFWNNKSQDFNDMINGFGDVFLQIARKLKYPTRYINNFTKRQKIGRTTLYRYIKLFDKLAKRKGVKIEKELNILKRMFNSDVVWDEIVEIKYIKPTSDYVYDISVEGLETFTTFDGIITHNTMRTYHFAGSAGIRVTYGLPRLIEIFDAKREPETPFMDIYLKKSFNNRETARKLAEDIVEKKVSDVIKSISINLSENSIEIEPTDLKRVSTIMKLIKESMKEVKVSERGKKIVVKLKPEIDVKELQRMKVKIMNLHVSGIKGISNAIIRREGEEWIINTIGSNLKEVLLLKEVDETRTVTNDIHEIASIFGIEAARNAIINEALKTLQEQGLNVDIRHIILVGDIMTFTGEVKPIGRYGVAGAQTSILARAAFEETIKHLVRASIRNEVDNFLGIFENVMVGQVIPSGTGMFDLLAKFEETEEEKK